MDTQQTGVETVLHDGDHSDNSSLVMSDMEGQYSLIVVLAKSNMAEDSIHAIDYMFSTNAMEVL